MEVSRDLQRFIGYETGDLTSETSPQESEKQWEEQGLLEILSRLDGNDRYKRFYEEAMDLYCSENGRNVILRARLLAKYFPQFREQGSQRLFEYDLDRRNYKIKGNFKDFNKRVEATFLNVMRYSEKRIKENK